MLECVVYGLAGLAFGVFTGRMIIAAFRNAGR